MSDLKISALPRASLASSDIIPYTVVATSVTSGISKAEFFTVTGASITSGTFTRGIEVSPSITGTADFAGAVIIAGSPLTVTGASITSGTLTRGILTSPSITGGAEFINNVTVGGIFSVTGASILSGTLTRPIIGSPSITGNAESSGVITTLGGQFVTGAASAMGYAAGAGGTVTQSIGGVKELAIALNRATGTIIWSNSVMAASTITSTLFGNSVIGINDILVINYDGNGRTGTNMRDYNLTASVVSPGAALINIKSNNNYADTSSIFAHFAVIKGAIT